MLVKILQFKKEKNLQRFIFRQDWRNAFGDNLYGEQYNRSLNGRKISRKEYRKNRNNPRKSARLRKMRARAKAKRKSEGARRALKHNMSIGSEGRNNPTSGEINTDIQTDQTKRLPVASFDPKMYESVPLAKNPNSEAMKNARKIHAQENIESANSLAVISFPKIARGIDEESKTDKDVSENSDSIKESWKDFFKHMVSRIQKGEELPSFDTALDELAIKITDGVAKQKMKQMFSGGDFSQITGMLGKNSGNIQNILGNLQGVNIPGIGNLGGMIQGFLGGGGNIGGMLKGITAKIPQKFKENPPKEIMGFVRQTDQYKQGLEKTKKSLKTPKSIGDLKKYYEAIRTRHNLNLQGKKLVHKASQISFNYRSAPIDLGGKEKKNGTEEELAKGKNSLSGRVKGILSMARMKTLESLKKNPDSDVQNNLSIFEKSFGEFYDGVQKRADNYDGKMPPFKDLVENLAQNIVDQIAIIKVRKETKIPNLPESRALSIARLDRSYAEGKAKIIKNFNKNVELTQFGNIYDGFKLSHDTLNDGIIFREKKSPAPAEESVSIKDKGNTAVALEEKRVLRRDDKPKKSENVEKVKALAEVLKGFETLKKSVIEGIKTDSDKLFTTDMRKISIAFWKEHFTSMQLKIGQSKLDSFNEDFMAKNIYKQLSEKGSNPTRLLIGLGLIKSTSLKNNAISSIRSKFKKPHDVMINGKKQSQTLIQGYNMFVKAANELLEK